ncbi:hypothetical protein NPIL_480541 [Nephila pilipes]|uniref:Uncharacterized protein n=1 Tax=Nephila pilipes TaxID=299642 RepID=A0A8X6N1E3_NEPPI|nr:hypothetical protein NPIL_480541 [Nephila pilipes]
MREGDKMKARAAPDGYRFVRSSARITLASQMYYGGEKGVPGSKGSGYFLMLMVVDEDGWRVMSIFFDPDRKGVNVGSVVMSGIWGWLGSDKGGGGL